MQGYTPLTFSLEKSSLSLLFLDRFTDFLEIKYVNSYRYVDVYLGKGFQILPFSLRYAPFSILCPMFTIHNTSVRNTANLSMRSMKLGEYVDLR